MKGVLFTDLTSNELHLLDSFEDTLYSRSTVTVYGTFGEERALAYVVPESSAHLMSDEKWDIESFKNDRLVEYLKGVQRFRDRFKN